MAEYVAVIAGATGAAAKRLVEVLLADPAWEVVGLSRHPPALKRDGLTFIASDLTVPASTRLALARCPQETHLI